MAAGRAAYWVEPLHIRTMLRKWQVMMSGKHAGQWWSTVLNGGQMPVYVVDPCLASTRLLADTEQHVVSTLPQGQLADPGQGSRGRQINGRQPLFMVVVAAGGLLACRVGSLVGCGLRTSVLLHCVASGRVDNLLASALQLMASNAVTGHWSAAVSSGRWWSKLCNGGGL